MVSGLEGGQVIVIIELEGKRIILLNGVRAETHTRGALKIEAADKLTAATRREPDAVAFGYLQGRWVAAA